MKNESKKLEENGLADRFVIPSKSVCQACVDRTQPCQVSRDEYPAMWWMHQAISLRLELCDERMK